jgi:predicted DNA-binding WGR domain protein
MPEVKYINQESNHNKMWSYEVSGTSITWRFGRIGSHITEQVEGFSNQSAMQKKISKKVAEKLAKGYKLVDQEKYEEEKQIAEDIGSRNKITKLMFVDKVDNQLLELQNYDPKKYVYVQIMDSWDKNVRNLLFSKTESHELLNMQSAMSFSQMTYCPGEFASGIRRYIKRLAEKVREVVTVMFAALGARKLSLGAENENEDDGFQAANVTPEFISKVGESKGASDQVIRTFAALGARKLDLD